MEVGVRKKFICRHCDREYPCGKSLGGHLRSHRLAGAVQFRHGNDIIPKYKLTSPPPPHVLRENPRKSRRFSDSGGGAPPHPAEQLCKECGKGFQSMKALCGHMACHSDKKEVSDSLSETETETGPRRGKRSKKLRYKTLDFNSNSSMSMSVPNGSSLVSEIEQEQEEVAICLMMLSRDSGYGYGKVFNSLADSSDNNSVVSDINKNVIGFSANSGYKKVKYDTFAKGKNKRLHYNKIDDESCKIRGLNYDKIIGCFDSVCESGENSIEADSSLSIKPAGEEFSGKGKAAKCHVCPICFRGFKSGHALGGHKRSHFLGRSEDRTLVVMAKKQVSGLLDLNLPAPDEEEDGRRGRAGFMAR